MSGSDRRAQALPEDRDVPVRARCSLGHEWDATLEIRWAWKETRGGHRRPITVGGVDSPCPVCGHASGGTFPRKEKR